MTQHHILEELNLHRHKCVYSEVTMEFLIITQKCLMLPGVNQSKVHKLLQLFIQLFKNCRYEWSEFLQKKFH
jgi:hypothetical protein